MKINSETNKITYRDMVTPVPRVPPAPPVKPVCTRYAKCKDCAYPSHGFVCWGGNSCLKTAMGNVIRRLENEKCSQ